MGWLFCKINLGGLGRNRTTDTRIFNSFVGQAATATERYFRVLPALYTLAFFVPDRTLIRLACALPRLFSRALGRQSMSRSECLMKRNFNQRPAGFLGVKVTAPLPTPQDLFINCSFMQPEP